MEPENAMQPVATVTGLYRGKFGGLEPLTPDKPLTPEELLLSHSPRPTLPAKW